jgi:aminocarboxymuconate-semialdehyde decarboxylase
VNDGYAAWATAHPDRLAPLATVPLQDPVAAAAELRRAVTVLGLRGVAVCTHVNGVDLDDTRFEPFLAEAAALDVPLFLHPQNSGDVARLGAYHLWNLVGFPSETAVAASRLILSGAFARHPRLKVVLAHGGGFLPYQLGRLDRGWRVRAGLAGRCPEPPSAYRRNIWCDSLVHSPEALRFLVERMGGDRVVLGSDHPFDMGDPAPLASLAAAGLPEADQARVAGATLAGLLRLA